MTYWQYAKKAIPMALKGVWDSMMLWRMSKLAAAAFILILFSFVFWGFVTWLASVLGAWLGVYPIIFWSFLMSTLMVLGKLFEIGPYLDD